MDDQNQKSNNEEISLDDMMAQAIENSEDPKDASEEITNQDQSEDDASKDQVAAESETVEKEVASEELSPQTTDNTEEAPTEESTYPDQKKEKKQTSTHVEPKEYKGKWYIVHTYSGHENKVAKTLMQRVQAMGFENKIFDALVPTRDTIRVRGGKKETIKEKIFPGYILVNMELSDEAWILVRTTPGVTSFVGAQNKPTPIRDEEVNAIVAFVGQKNPVYKAQFSAGEAVKITDGPFSDFLGTVESIDEAKGKIKVLVSIFGRETPVELDFLQVAKI